MDTTTVIIKVKYEDTLRRFSAMVNKEGLDLTMDGLMAKIRSLFTFAPGAKLQLTYVDEDGDLVALVDDEDLTDVWRQSLNPLRVTVSLITEKTKSSEPSGSSTPVPVLQNLNSGVSEILKSIPEPLRDTLSKLSSDMALKAKNTSPNLADFVDSLSELGMGYVNKLSETIDSKTKGDESTKDLQGSKVSVSENASKPKKVVSGGVEIAPSGGDSKASSLKEAAPGKGKEVKKESFNELTSKGFGFTYGGAPLSASPCPGFGTTFDNIKDASGSVPSSWGWGSVDPIRNNNMDIHPPFYGSNMNECPFAGTPLAETPLSREPHHRRNHGLNKDAIFHRGVRCDGCGAHPISGTRFKSKVKEDYDLCNVCFSEMGNEAEYMRIDRPLTYRPFNRLVNHHSRVLNSTLPPILRGGFGGRGHNRPKLDSRFIQDVNIVDGTLMAPSTTFTKIWRMRNNGTIVWPQGCQLVWIGGDKLTQTLSVGLEIAALGLPVHHEIDVAVDFVAPELPGRYISYWRLASPSGQKFGQRVWVLLQVDASMKEPVVHETVHQFNLNWPPPSVTVPESENLKPESEISKTEPMVEDNNVVVTSEQENEANFPINDSLLIGEGSSSSSVLYPVIDLTQDAPPVTPTFTTVPPPPPPPPARVVEVGTDSGEVENIAVEESLLKELEDMGFKEIDLNKKVLRLNKYDLEQSVDDLCTVSEWDPMLDELEEMGFHDKETNKRLLQKNNGSLKRVVMDLIAGERD